MDFESLNQKHIFLAGAVHRIEVALAEVHGFQKWLLEERNKALHQHLEEQSQSLPTSLPEKDQGDGQPPITATAMQDSRWGVELGYMTHTIRQSLQLLGGLMEVAPSHVEQCLQCRGLEGALSWWLETHVLAADGTSSISQKQASNFSAAAPSPADSQDSTLRESVKPFPPGAHPLGLDTGSEELLTAACGKCGFPLANVSNCLHDDCPSAEHGATQQMSALVRRGDSDQRSSRSTQSPQNSAATPPVPSPSPVDNRSDKGRPSTRDEG